MKVKALVTYGGQYALTKDQVADLPDNAVTQQLIQEGYLAVEVDGVAVEDMTKAQLIEACKQMDIKATDKMTKAQLIETLEGSGYDEHGEAE